MVKIVLSVFLFFFLSCNINDYSLDNEEGEECVFYEISNSILKEEILKYDKETKLVGPSDNKVIHVSVEVHNDTTTYWIDYSFDAYGILSAPSTIFSKAADKLIAVTIGGFGGFGGLNDFALPDSVTWRYLKNIFPDDYRNMLSAENNSSDSIIIDYALMSTIVEHYPVWRLKFAGDKFISKEKILL